MKPTITLDKIALGVLNNCMAPLDSMDLISLGRPQRSPVSICNDLRTELLQKATKNRQKEKAFTMKLAYYKAEALYQYLTQFEIYFPDNFGPYEKNKILQIRNEIHGQL